VVTITYWRLCHHSLPSTNVLNIRHFAVLPCWTRVTNWSADYPCGDGQCPSPVDRVRLKCDGTRVETRFRLSAKRTSPFKSAGASVQSTTGSRVVRISGNNAGYTMFRGSVKSTGYPLHSPVSPSPPLPRVTVCHHISTGLYGKKLYPVPYFIRKKKGRQRYR
jgi:hypothetical protein